MTSVDRGKIFLYGFYVGKIPTSSKVVDISTLKRRLISEELYDEGYPVIHWSKLLSS